MIQRKVDPKSYHPICERIYWRITDKRGHHAHMDLTYKLDWGVVKLYDCLRSEWIDILFLHLRELNLQRWYILNAVVYIIIISSFYRCSAEREPGMCIKYVQRNLISDVVAKLLGGIFENNSIQLNKDMFRQVKMIFKQYIASNQWWQRGGGIWRWKVRHPQWLEESENFRFIERRCAFLSKFKQAVVRKQIYFELKLK